MNNFCGSQPPTFSPQFREAALLIRRLQTVGINDPIVLINAINRFQTEPHERAMLLSLANSHPPTRPGQQMLSSHPVGPVRTQQQHHLYRSQPYNGSNHQLSHVQRDVQAQNRWEASIPSMPSPQEGMRRPEEAQASAMMPGQRPHPLRQSISQSTTEVPAEISRPPQSTRKQMPQQAYPPVRLSASPQLRSSPSRASPARARSPSISSQLRSPAPSSSPARPGSPSISSQLRSPAAAAAAPSPIRSPALPAQQSRDSASPLQERALAPPPPGTFRPLPTLPYPNFYDPPQPSQPARASKPAHPPRPTRPPGPARPSQPALPTQSARILQPSRPHPQPSAQPSRQPQPAVILQHLQRKFTYDQSLTILLTHENRRMNAQTPNPQTTNTVFGQPASKRLKVRDLVQGPITEQQNWTAAYQAEIENARHGRPAANPDPSVAAPLAQVVKIWECWTDVLEEEDLRAELIASRSRQPIVLE